MPSISRKDPLESIIRTVRQVRAKQKPYPRSGVQNSKPLMHAMISVVFFTAGTEHAMALSCDAAYHTAHDCLRGPVRSLPSSGAYGISDPEAAVWWPKPGVISIP